MQSSWEALARQNALGIQMPGSDSTESDLAYLQNPQTTLNQGAVPKNNPVSYEQQLQDALQAQQLKRQQLGAQQESGIEQLRQYQQNLAAQPIQTDLTPLAGLVDYMNQGRSNLSQSIGASTARQQTAQGRNEALADLQKNILNQQMTLGKEDFGGLKDQLDFYKAQQAAKAEALKEHLAQIQSQKLDLANQMMQRRADLGDRRADLTEKHFADLADFYKNNNRSVLQGDRIQNQIHSKVVNSLGADKMLGQRLTQVNNLDNAVQAFQQGTATPQQFAELQQAVRSNMGIKSGSGVGEREEVYLKSLGINSAAVKQFITGKPQDIQNFTDPAMINHVMRLVAIEKDNVQKQADMRIKALTAGHESMYEKRPDLTEDLHNKAQAVGQQFGAEEAAKEANPTYKDGDTVEHDGKKFQLSNGVWAEVAK